MKTILLLGIALLAAMNSRAKTLEITVPNLRSDKGSVLAMAVVAGQEKPVYGMVAAKEGGVSVTLDMGQAETADVSLFHDQNADHKMNMGDRGPTEGYATRKCKLTEERTVIKINLFYPDTAQ